MIKHIVAFKLRDNSPEACQKAKEVLLGMREEVPEIIDIQVGIDFLHSERSYDLVLEVQVADEAALEAYQEHPYHVGVVKEYMHKARSGSIAVDYII